MLGRLADGSTSAMANAEVRDLLATYAELVPDTAFRLDELAPGAYLAVAIEGEHGDEGAIAALRVGALKSPRFARIHPRSARSG